MERINQNICEIHQIKKDYLFCLEQNCEDRLCCIECYAKENLHKEHRCIILKDFLRSEESELGRVFNQKFLNAMKEWNNDINQFIEVFNRRIEKIMDEREEELISPIYKFINK